MTDETQQGDVNGTQNEQAPQDPPRFSLKGQYIKDLSLENPNAPHSLMASKQPPKVDLNIDLQGQKVQEHLYELTVVINVKAESDKVLFVVELSYAGLFELYNIPEQLLERVLLVDSAFTLFPYVRRVVSDLTRDAGFPPLMLEPVDFLGLYERRKAAEAQQGEAAVN